MENPLSLLLNEMVSHMPAGVSFDVPAFATPKHYAPSIRHCLHWACIFHLAPLFVGEEDQGKEEGASFAMNLRPLVPKNRRLNLSASFGVA
jgi:hypothetical protein